MGAFNFNGVDGIAASFLELAHLSDEETYNILRPAAEFLKSAQQSMLKTVFRQRTGVLADSLSVREKRNEDGAFLQIYAKGKHPGSSTGKRMKKERNGKRRSSGSYQGTNAEILYILEYGSPRIKARHAIETANENSYDEFLEYAAKGWDEYLKSKGL